MSATLFTLHENHGVIVGQDVTEQDADAYVGGLFRSGLTLKSWAIQDRAGNPVSVVAHVLPGGGVDTVVEYA
jgi:hypothetical protein